MKGSSTVVVLTTAGSGKEAQALARRLLQQKAAACVNIVDGSDSWYWWKSKITHEKEKLLLIKTQRSALKTISKILKKYHSYTLPELIALPIGWGEKHYLDWLRQNIQSH